MFLERKNNGCHPRKFIMTRIFCYISEKSRLAVSPFFYLLMYWQCSTVAGHAKANPLSVRRLDTRPNAKCWRGKPQLGRQTRRRSLDLTFRRNICVAGKTSWRGWKSRVVTGADFNAALSSRRRLSVAGTLMTNEALQVLCSFGEECANTTCMKWDFFSIKKNLHETKVIYKTCVIFQSCHIIIR